MNAWMERCIDEWMKPDGWMDGLMDGQMDGWMDKCINGWMDE